MLQHIIADVDAVLAQTPSQPLSHLPPGHGLRNLGRQLETLATQSLNDEDIVLGFSQKVVQLLFKTSTQLGREFYVVVLERLCDTSPKVAKEALGWLLYAEDEVRILYRAASRSDLTGL